MYNVVVYGTLRKGFGNHRLLTTSEELFAGSLPLPYRMISLGAFPGLIPTEDNHDISVEIYKVTEEVLERLDRLEGYTGSAYDGFYGRDVIDTPVGPAYVYVLGEAYEGHEPVTSGNWREFKSNDSWY